MLRLVGEVLRLLGICLIIVELATRRGMIRYPMGPVGATVTIPPAALPLQLPDNAR